MMIAAPRVNVAAWFGLAVAVPLALLGLAAAGTSIGLARSAGFWVALLLAPAVVLALRSLETRQFQDAPATQHDEDLVRAFCLTTGQACGLLLVVLAGARFSGEAVAVGLAMAGVPLTLAVASDIWRRIFLPLEAPQVPLAPSQPVATAQPWAVAWPENERLTPARRPRPLLAEPVRALERQAQDRLLQAIQTETEILHEAAMVPVEADGMQQPAQRQPGPRLRLAFEQAAAPVTLPLKRRRAKLSKAPDGVVRQFQPNPLWTPEEEDAPPRRAAAGG